MKFFNSNSDADQGKTAAKPNQAPERQDAASQNSVQTDAQQAPAKQDKAQHKEQKKGYFSWFKRHKTSQDTPTREPSAPSKEPSAPNKEPSALGSEPPAQGKEPSAQGKEPSAQGKEPSAPGSERERSAQGKEPSALGKEPPAPNREQPTQSSATPPIGETPSEACTGQARPEQGGAEPGESASATPSAQPKAPEQGGAVQQEAPATAESASAQIEPLQTPLSSEAEDVAQTRAQRDTVNLAAGQSPAATPSAEPATSEPRGEQVQTPATQAAEPSKKDGFFTRLKRGLNRTSESFVAGLGNLFLGKKTIDADMLEELESQLLIADVGVEATLAITANLTDRVSRKELTQPEALQQALKDELLSLLIPCEKPLEVSAHSPYVILMVGVNGVGKTTTIGKLAKRYMGEGRSVMLAAGDTFRAAAVEQLQVWGERNQVPVIAQHTGADSASVIFDALQAAKARNVDVLIADTAGRLHNKDNLMDELRKVVRVMGKLDDSAPHEVMLVLDAGTGQNALAQAASFQEAVGVSGLALTKLDGTAKGGVIFAIARKLGLPIRFIGVGEAAEDLRPFVAKDFVDALFGEERK